VSKTAVVTGGGSGIGAAIVNRLRSDGYRVAVLDLNPSDSEFSYVADVTDRAQIDAALGEIRAALGPVTILVNAAGKDSFRRFTDISFDQWRKIIDINLNGVFHTIQAVLPDMLDAGWDASSTSPRRAPTPEFRTCRPTWPPSPASTD